MFRGDIARDRHADVRDTEREKPALERKASGILDGLLHVERISAELSGRAFFADIKILKRVIIKSEKIERVLNYVFLNQNIGEPPAERLDIECVTTREMFKPPLKLCRTGRVYASNGNFTFIFHDIAAADWTPVGENVRSGGDRALLDDHSVDRGDDVSRLDDPYMIADADILRGDLLGIVKRGTRYDAAGEFNAL